MNSISLPCQIDAYCSINASEITKNIEQAMTNVISDVSIDVKNNTIHATANNLNSLTKIYETIHTRNSSKIFRNQLNKNASKNSTWFYLNKQAAFVNKIALCTESEESPLGPIKVILTSEEIDEIIDRLGFP